MVSHNALHITSVLEWKWNQLNDCFWIYKILLIKVFDLTRIFFFFHSTQIEPLFQLKTLISKRSIYISNMKKNVNELQNSLLRLWHTTWLFCQLDHFQFHYGLFSKGTLIHQHFLGLKRFRCHLMNTLSMIIIYFKWSNIRTISFIAFAWRFQRRSSSVVFYILLHFVIILLEWSLLLITPLKFFNTTKRMGKSENYCNRLKQERSEQLNNTIKSMSKWNLISSHWVLPWHFLDFLKNFRHHRWSFSHNDICTNRL